MAEFVVPPHQREFHCIHCKGRILIPRELPPTTGPCPHCGGIITSPALELETPRAFSLPPAPVPPPEPVAPSPPPQESLIVERPAPPLEIAEPPPPVPVEIPTRPAEKPALIEIPANKELSERNKPKKSAPAPAKPKRSGLVPALLILLALFLLGAAVVYFAARELGQKKASREPHAPLGDTAQQEASYIRTGWQKDANKALLGFMAATTVQGKIPYILHGKELTDKIEDFYGGSVINDSDTPAEGFSVYELSEEDRKRGLFMMIYDQPPQFEMREFFRPLASLEVQYGVDEADLLLSTLSRVDNFAMEPLRVHAFFKRTAEGLKLDWEIFVQTKYRRLQNFVELPEPAAAAVFRVFIVEDVPDKGRPVAGTRAYRVVDPANVTDSARINVKVDSEIGRALSLINWLGTKENRPITKTATLELKWTGDPAAPELEISRFLCWEFLGLGGQETGSTASGQ